MEFQKESKITKWQKIIDWFYWNFHICSYCHWRRATYFYAPGRRAQTACDKCVPRGCTCNEEPVDGDWENVTPNNWKELVDEQGRKYPCCEWFEL